MSLPVELPPRSSVLVAGAGGGFDVVCGLPVALALREQGHHVHLANYSFSQLDRAQSVERPLPCLHRVTAESGIPDEPYFPECGLARWWGRDTGDGVVWGFSRTGVRPLREAYQWLVEELNLDALFVVDGGVDGIFIGDEYNLGSPSMDAISIMAASQAAGGRPGFFVMTAFGTEGRAYSVRHADALLRVADLIREDGMHGVWAPRRGTGPGDGFLEALDEIHSRMPEIRHSIVANSIAAAMEGCFGETAVTVRAVDAPVWVSPLTLLYWFFDLGKVAWSRPYYDEVADTSTVQEVADAIERLRMKVAIRERSDIPI